VVHYNIPSNILLHVMILFDDCRARFIDCVAFAGSSLVSSTGEQTPSMARQYGGLTRKYGSDGGDELAACLPPDLRHLLSATTAATPQSHLRQTTTQRLQQHGLLQRSTAATAAANSLVSLSRFIVSRASRQRPSQQS
jgi:hypothetical protein